MNLRAVPLFIALLFVGVSAVHAAAPSAKIIMTTGSVSEREGPIYVAQEQGFFRKYGVDVSFVQVRNGPVGMAALSSGETQLHWGSVSGANLGAIAEGADLVFVGGFINRLTGMFVANPKITAPADLKGKYIGVNSLSGGNWIFTMLTLDYWASRPSATKFNFVLSAINRSWCKDLWPAPWTPSWSAMRTAKTCRTKAIASWPISKSCRFPIKARDYWRDAAS